MRLIFEPTVRLIGKQTIDYDALQGFLDDNDVSTWETDTDVAGETLVEVAGRLCYMSFAKPRPGGNKAYTEHILEVGHGSVLEHAVYNLIFEGVSRSLTHEMVRHRAGMGYSQLSQRFVDESGCAFVVPPALACEVSHAVETLQSQWPTFLFGDASPDDVTEMVFTLFAGRTSSELSESDAAGLRWLKANAQAMRCYKQLSDYGMAKLAHIPDATARRKAAREAARSVLPNCTETKIFVTGNARALRHFIEMRGNAAADAEIRRLALATLKVLQAEAVNLFGDYAIAEDPQHGTHITTPYRKV